MWTIILARHTEQHNIFNMEVNPTGYCLTQSKDQQKEYWENIKSFREGMAIGSQPTVLDRLKERLVVALGKSQDKRVKHAQSKMISVGIS